MTLCAFVVQWLVLYTCSECCRYYNTNDKRNLSITTLHKPFHFAWLIIFAALLTNAIFANNHKNDICKEIVINLRRFIFTRVTILRVFYFYFIVNSNIYRYPSILTHRNIATVILHVPDNLEKHFSLDSLFYYQTLPFHCVSPLAQFEGEKDMRKDFVLHMYKSKFKR